MSLVNFSLGDIGNLFKDIREAITGEKIKDPNKKAEIELKLSQLEQALKEGQIQINKAEASNPNWFVAGWRPAIGWVGALALIYTFILNPLIDWGCQLAGVKAIPPTLDMGMLFNLVISMLGLGGMRTYEKTKNIQGRH